MAVSPAHEPFSSKPPAGEGFVWLTAMGLALGIIMIFCLLGYIFLQGVQAFWPRDVQVVTLAEGSAFRLGDADQLAGVPIQTRIRKANEPGQVGELREETQFFLGNKDAYGQAFRFVNTEDIVATEQPEGIMVAERLEWGEAIFFPVALIRADGSRVEAERADFHEQLDAALDEVTDRRRAIEKLEKGQIGRINSQLERWNRRVTILERRHDDPTSLKEYQELKEKIAEARAAFDVLREEASALRAQQNDQHLVYELITGEVREIELGLLVEVYRPNRMHVVSKFGHFLGNFWNFLSQNPREANTQGGIFPTIFGTFVMTLIMSLAVMPFGVLAAIYLREYAVQGPFVRAVRIAINNLAGVPSIVYGVFGLGFFVYFIGAFIDTGPENPVSSIWWTIALGGLIASGVMGYFTTFVLEVETPTMRWVNFGLWAVFVACLVTVIFFNPFFGGFFADKFEVNKQPTFGSGGVLWAGLTLALMTVPVVVVATEEAFASVPGGLREASLACGASKWQTIQRIVIPAAAPGILTGLILAIARGAGEVAPLMLVGVVKLAPSLPFDSTFPFVHLERKFMHLGFHIYDLGFQSPDSEAARPMVFATTFLLIMLVIVLNLGAILIREHLRKKYASGSF